MSRGLKNQIRSDDTGAMQPFRHRLTHAGVIVEVLLLGGAAIVVAVASGSLVPSLSASVLVASALWVVLTARATVGSEESMPELQDSVLERELMRYRRREANATVLVIRSSAPKRRIDELCGSLRTTDAYALVRSRGAYELHAVLDAHGLDSERLEQRIRHALAGYPASIGWASFPKDGLILATLRERASASADAGVTTNSERRDSGPTLSSVIVGGGVAVRQEGR
jgi:hypothetical protein